MSNKNTGGNAFPTAERTFETGIPITKYMAGMTLRDYFAGQVVSAIMLTAEGSRWHQEAIAKHAYEVADAMIAESGVNRQNPSRQPRESASVGLDGVVRPEIKGA